jgi:hypothetical protein
MTQVWASKEHGFDFVGNFARQAQAENSQLALRREAVPSAAVVTLVEEYYLPSESFSKVIHAGEHRTRVGYYFPSPEKEAEFLARVESGEWKKPGD